MKKIIFILALLLLISSISVSALRIGKVRYTDDFFLVNVHNNEAQDLEDLKIKVMVMDDMTFYNTKMFDLDKKETKGQYIITDEPVTGLVKITVRNDDTRRVRYYII